MAKPIKIEILGDASGFKKAVGDVEGGLSKMGGGISSVGGMLTGLLAGGAIAAGASAMLSLGSSTELQLKKISTVFGESEAGVREWADGVNEQFGISETGVTNLAASMSDLLKPMGFTGAEAAKISQEMIGLAPALAEWSGGTHNAAQVSELMNKALLGETDGLLAVGIAIDAAMVQERALALAKADGRKEITKMDEALAVQQLIMEQTTDAQAGFTGGTDTLAGKQAYLKAKFAEAKEYLATKLIPVFAKMADYVINNVVPALQDFAEKMRELWEKHAPRLKEIFIQVKDGFMQVVSFFKENQPALIGLLGAIAIGFAVWAAGALIAAAGTVAAMAPFIAAAAVVGLLVAAFAAAYQNVDWFRNAVDRAVEFLKGTVWPALQSIAAWIKNDLVPTMRSIGDKFGEVVVAISDGVLAAKNKLAEIQTKIGEVVTAIVNTAGDIKDAVLKPFKDGIDAVKELWEDLKRTLKIKIDIPNPLSGLGGLVGRASGGPISMGGLVNVGERGPETVWLPKGANVTANHAGGGQAGGSVVNVYAQTNANPYEIAREVAWINKTAGR